ncbi:DNA-binding transcriptional regulator, MarR family [Paenibacillus sp. 1_12]|uniref:MarR family winged helix-turn-helix transcriptional regulator n=1 Tax=Paenibacillus sp. 1_12 TaxID=1566278 RepID=UPI0008E42257|nr:MarR family transcriptional regulator [Paenibacillus sp. 1_12]SFK96124.1 DNA-binding transcriptional regulator, MarR family [Paenibacillus sp. 1_12]
MAEEMASIVKEMSETFERFGKTAWRKQTVNGIKSSEIRVLLCLNLLTNESDHGVNISDISKRLSVTSPTVTQMIKNLIAAGLVERFNDATDKRITLLRLTGKGEVVAQKATERYQFIFSGLIEKLGEEQSRTLILLLNEVYNHFYENNSKEMTLVDE